MSDKEVKIKITADVSDLEKRLKSIEDSLKSLGKNDMGGSKSINSIIDDANKADKVLENFKETAEDTADVVKDISKSSHLDELTTDIGDAKKEMKSFADESEEVANSVKDISKATNSIDTKPLQSMAEMGEKIKENFDNVGESISNAVKDANKIDTVNVTKDMAQKANIKVSSRDGRGLTSDVVAGLSMGTAASVAMKNSLNGVVNELKEVSKAFKTIEQCTSIEDKIAYYNRFGEEVKQTKQEISDLETQIKKLNASTDDSGKSQKQLEELLNRLSKAKEKLAAQDLEKQGVGDEFIKQLSAYDKLEKKVREFMNTNDKSALSIKQVYDALDEANVAMARMYNKMDYLDMGEWEKVNNAARDYLETINLISYDNLSSDLDYLNKNLDKKIDKMKEVKDANQNLDHETRAYIDSIKQEADAIKEYADNAGYAIKANKELKAGSSDFDLTGNNKFLEDMSKGNYLAKIKEQNKAIQEYLSLVEQTGRISKKYLDDSGNFDPKKYLADIEKYGKPINQLVANYKALKQQALEYLKTGDEVDESTKRSAKATLEAAKAAKIAAEEKYELAKADRNAAQSSEEYAKETEKVDKAYKDLISSKKKLKEAEKQVEISEKSEIDRKREVVKKINEQAEALRKLGAAAEDINLKDIKNIDKVLGTKLKDLFPNDLPKSFGEIGEYIKAAFGELNALDFGNFGSLLKDAGSGLLKNIFAKLPAQAKLAAVAIAGVTVALNKLYESGKQQFFSGLSNAAQKLQPIIGAFRSFGREAITAFESLTGTHIDLSSLMEIGPNFEYQMQKVGTIAGSNTRQLGELTKKAESLGGSTMYTATQVGQAFEYMAMAGYDTEEMLSSINGVVSLSIASGTDLATTSDIVTDYMTAMGMSASNTSDFVDKLAATVTSSNTTVEKFGMSMKQVASQAGSLGISMTDLATAIGLQANAGVKGSKAGTALKNILSIMAAPTEKQEKALKKLGLTANETGSYFKTTADGAVDLEATVKQLMTSTDNMTRTQKAAVLAQMAGREALPGLMALLSQGADGWDELSSNIENSTGKVQYWNECISTLAGKSGEEATKAIDNMKKVFAETELEAIDLGLSTEDLSHAIAILGDDGNVTTQNIKDLFDVIESMNLATGKTEEQWRSLDKAGKTAINTGYDYDATIAKIAADTTGLTQEKKELIKSQLDENMSFEEADAILKQYGLSAERTSFSTLTYADKLGYLRDTLGDTLDETEKATLKNLGLGDSIDEISEILKMSDTEFQAYTKNLETVKGMAEQMADAMDEVTKGSLLTLASAIENVCIAAFNKLKPAIKGAADAVNEFFDTWHNGETNEFTWDGLEKGLSGLSDKVRQQEGNMKQAVVDLFASVNRFINGGSLKSILDMGTSIVQGICKGIQEAKGNGSLDEAIDGAIKNISNWITKNGPAIAEAGETILDSLTEGIKNNEGAITDAMNSICDIMTSWASSSGSLKSAAGLFAEQFVGLAVENMWIGFKSWIGEKFTAFGELFSGPFSIVGGGGGMGMNLWTNIMEGIFGVDPIGEAKDWLKKKLSNFHPIQWIKEQLFGKSSGKSGGGSKDKIKPEELINIPSLDEIKSHIKSKIGNFNIKDFIKGLLVSGATLMGGPGAGAGMAGAIKVADLINIPTLGEIKEFITSKFSGFNIKEFIKTLLMGGATSMGGPGGAVGGALLKAADLFGEWNPVEDIKGWLDEKVGDWGITKWFKEKFGNKDGKGEKVKVSDLLELDTEKLAEIETQLNSLSTTASTVSTNVVTAFNNITNTARTSFVNMANIVRNQLVSCTNIVRNQAVNMANIVRNQALNMSNIFRNQFTSMANIARNQMVNVSNIIRNQAISWGNVIRNQVTNARNTFTSQFLSMAAVARTQMVNISNIIRNQAVSWSNVIRNQTANMKASFTAAFSGLSSIAASQMAKCLSTVRSYMSQIRAATAQTMTMNFRVNKTITTTNVTRSVAQGAARTMSNIARNGSSLIAPQAVAIGGNIVGGSGRTNNGLGGANALQLSIPLTVDGREIARATASYNQEELSKLSKRNNRRRGE